MTTWSADERWLLPTRPLPQLNANHINVARLAVLPSLNLISDQLHFRPKLPHKKYLRTHYLSSLGTQKCARSADASTNEYQLAVARNPMSKRQKDILNQDADSGWSSAATLSKCVIYLSKTAPTLGFWLMRLSTYNYKIGSRLAELGILASTSSAPTMAPQTAAINRSEAQNQPCVLI